MSNNFQIREPIVLIEHAHELEPVGSVAEVKLVYGHVVILIYSIEK